MIISYIKRNYDIVIIATITLISMLIGSSCVQKGMVWYHDDILKPLLTPPDWVFFAAWSIIFVCNAIALFFLSRLYRHTATWRLLIGLCAITALLNVAWSYLFFCQHAISLALLDGIVLQLTVLVAIGATWQPAREVALLLLPYAIWLCMALYLNYQIMILNPGW